LSNRRPIRAVIFDLGHTIWDFAPTETSWRLNIVRLRERLLAAHGSAPAPNELAKALQTAVRRWMMIWDSDVLAQPRTSVLVSEALADVGISPTDEFLEESTITLFGRELEMPVVPPDSLAALGELQSRGIAMGCVSNTISLEEGIHDALRRLGLLRYFTVVVASSSMGYKKPHRSLFERALQGVDVEPPSAVFVGDRLVDDISGAQAVGMRAILTHQFRQEDVAATNIVPDAVVGRLAELPGVIDAFESDEGTSEAATMAGEEEIVHARTTR